MNIIPIIIVGGAIAFAMKKKKPKPKPKSDNGDSGKALPASSRGTIFHAADLPDLIKAGVGDSFSIAFPSLGGSTGYVRKLAASPADNSVTHVKTEYDEIGNAEGMPGGQAGEDVYIFKGAKKGKGSLVFHVQAPWLEGKEAPSEIVEIQTEIS